MSVTVIVHKRTAGAESHLIVPESGLFGRVSERSVAVVTVKNVLAVRGTENVIKTVVVVVSNAHAAGPPQRVQTSFFCNVGKCAVPIVFIQSIRRPCGNSLQTSTRKHEQIHPPIIVEINESAAASSRLDDVLLRLFVPINHRSVQARFRGNIDEMGVEGATGGRCSRRGLGGMTSHTLLREQAIRGK